MKHRSAPHPALLSAILLVLAVRAEASSLEALARGDAAYARRAEGHSGLWAAPDAITEAISAYEEALRESPGNHLIRARLLRALFYKGDYVLRDRDAKLEAFERGQVLGEQGIDILLAETSLDRAGRKCLPDLIDHLESHPEAAGVYYWTAVHWGVWGRHRGKIAAARQGVAGKVRDYAEIVTRLDSSYEDGSAHRMLGRLHAEAPKIPLVTGWIDRDRAIVELETARRYSNDSLTLLYFIEALLDYDTSRRSEAMELLRNLVTRNGGSDFVVEDARAVSDARALLASLNG